MTARTVEAPTAPTDPLHKFRGVLAFLEGAQRDASRHADEWAYDVSVAIKTLSAALAEAEQAQEPVAWHCPNDPDSASAFFWRRTANGVCPNCGKKLIPVFLASPPAPTSPSAAPAEKAVAVPQSCEWTHCPNRVGDRCCKEAAAPAAPQPADTRKPCTCDGAGRGPGRACVVKAGGRLGELWRCAQGCEPAPQPAKGEAP